MPLQPNRPLVPSIHEIAQQNEAIEKGKKLVAYLESLDQSKIPPYEESDNIFSLKSITDNTEEE